MEHDEEFVDDEILDEVVASLECTPEPSEDETDDAAADDVEEDVPIRFVPPRDDSCQTLQGHKESVFCVIIDPTQRFLASGGQDHIAIVWDLQNNATPVFTTHGHNDSVTCLAFSMDGYYLATGDMSGGVRVWSRPGSTDDTTWTLELAAEVGDLQWLTWWQPPDPKPRKTPIAVLAAGDINGAVTVWSIPHTNPSHVKYLPGSGIAATCGSFYGPSINTDRPKLAVLYTNASFKLWDVKSSEPLVTASLNSSRGENEVICMACPQSRPLYDGACKDREYLVWGGDGVIQLAVVRQVDAGGEPSFVAKSVACFETGIDGSVECIDFSWTHPFFAFGTVHGTIGIVDTTKLRVRQKWTYTTDESTEPIGITALRWSHTCPVFFTSTTNGALIAWHGLGASPEATLDTPGSPEPLRIWWGHEAMILDFCLLPSTGPGMLEPLAVTASDDSTVKMFALNI